MTVVIPGPTPDSQDDWRRERLFCPISALFTLLTFLSLVRPPPLSHCCCLPKEGDRKRSMAFPFGSLSGRVDFFSHGDTLPSSKGVLSALRCPHPIGKDFTMYLLKCVCFAKLKDFDRSRSLLVIYWFCTACVWRITLPV